MAGLTTEQALTQARASGKDVQATAATTPDSTLTAHPNGTFTVNQSLAPVRKRVKGGRWVNLDPTLHRNADGTISPAVTTSNVILSGGGSGPVAIMNSDGRSLALTLPMSLPTPTVSGATATYANVLPGVDLTITSDAQGDVSDVLIVKDAAAAANPELRTLALATHATGVSVSSDNAGNITANDRSGHPVFTASAPQMWDSATTGTASTAASVKDPITGRQVDRRSGQPITSSPAGPGEGAHTAPIAIHASNRAITLTPSASLLTGTKTVYPLYIDPTFIAPSASSPLQAWTQIVSAYPSSSYWKSSSTEPMRVGDNNWNCPCFTARSFFQVGVPSQLYGSTVLSSQINFTEVWAPSCTAKPVELWQSGAISSATTWNNPPSLTNLIGSQTVAHGYDSSCPTAGVGFDIGNIMQTAVNGRWGNITFALKAGDETDPYGWKQFTNSVSTSTTYDHVPNTPTTLTTSPTTSCADDTVVGDGSVTLYAGVSDPDGGTVGVHFEAWPASGSSSNPTGSTDPNTLTEQSGSTAVYVLSKTALEGATNKDPNTGLPMVTEFDWNVQVYDFNYTSSWSTTCHFSFDPTRPGAPVITQPGTTTIGQPFPVTISAPSGGTTPSSYEYQVNGGAPANAPADSSGNATITITPTRRINVLSVSSLSAGANYGDSASITFDSGNPSPSQADGDLNGDGVPDLFTVGGQNGIPSGLWTAPGKIDPGNTTGDGQIVTSATDIGVKGNGFNTNGGPSDFDGATAITGRFTDSGFQDVLVYYPSGTNNTYSASGAIYSSNGDGSPLDTQDISYNHDFSAGDLADQNGDNPTQLINAGNTSGNNNPYADLIGITGDSNNPYGLQLYQAGGIGFYLPTPLIAASPDGTSWNNWTLATTQLPTSGGGSSTAMFLWNKTTGVLDLWENLATTTDSNGNLHLTYTAYPVETGWNTSAAITLQAADINGDGVPDLWVVGGKEQVVAHLFTNLSTSSTANDDQLPSQTLATADHTWNLNDGTTGTITTAADTTGANANGALTATASGGATWTTGDLFSPAAHTDGASGYLTAATSTATIPSAISTSGDFTVSAWVKPQTLGGTFLGQDGTTTSGFGLYTDPSTQTWRFEMPQSDTSNPTTDVATASTLTAQVGAWAHIAATYSSSSGTMTLYVNGVAAATASHTSKWNANGGFTIGAYLWNSTRSGFFQGDIADVQAYTQALSGAQIAALSDTYYVPAGGTVVAQVSGDFNGDGKSDIAHLYNYGGGHLALTATLADTNGDGGFNPSRLIWDDPTAGATMNYVYAAAGDFNGDGKTDIALFYNYTDNNNQHDSVYVLYATANGGFTAPTRVWDDLNFGPNTKFITAGSFNGATLNSHKLDDIALFYNYTDYSNQHVGVFTMTSDSNGDGGVASPSKKWDSTNWGSNTQFMDAGDFNGDGKTDIALFYHYADYSGDHVGLFTMTADSNGDGGLAGPGAIWSSTNWGPNTKMMTVGDFNGDGKADIALFYNYVANNNWSVALFTTAGQTGSSPTSQWSNTDWGPNTQFMNAGDFNGDGKSDIALYYKYVNYYPAVFTLTADNNGDGGFASPVRRFSDY